MNKIALPVVRETPEILECTECAKCCTYVGVGIDGPKKASDTTDILWYLYHPGVYIYVDGNDEWSVHFETRCVNLKDDLLCAIYETRPHLCRTFDNQTCEVNDHEHEALTFRDPVSFLEWLRDTKPKVFRKVEAKYLPPDLHPGPSPDAKLEKKKRKKDKKKRKDKKNKKKD